MIGCDDMDRINSPEIINKKLDVYLSNFTEKDLEEYEEAIFTNKMSKRTRAELELNRLREDIIKKPNQLNNVTNRTLFYKGDTILFDFLGGKSHEVLEENGFR